MPRNINRHLALCGALLIASLFVPYTTAQTQRPGHAVSFTKGQYLLERRLIRELKDGKKIIVTRQWRVTVLPQENGNAIMHGHQVSATVDAPKQLKPLADLEASRVENALFPITLDRFGHIIEANAKDADDKEQTSIQNVDKVASKALQILSEASLRGADSQTAVQFVERVRTNTSGHLGRVPSDLFSPTTLESEQELALPLPNGKVGSLIIHRTATLHDRGGLMKTATREISTSIGTDVRRSKEEWHFAPE